MQYYNMTIKLFPYNYLNLFRYIFCFFLISPFIQNAQNNIETKQVLVESLNETSVYEAQSLFSTTEVENILAQRLGTTVSECNGFFSYLNNIGKLNYSEYLSQVEAGTINKENALQYWLDQIPQLETLYTQELDNFQTAKKNANKPFIPNTGGAVCNNLDVGNGTLSGWTGAWHSTRLTDLLPPPSPYGNINTAGLNSSGGYNNMSFVHELCTAGTDPIIPSISRVPPGHTYSVRLGNDMAANAYNHQTLSNTFKVTALNNTITYWYSVLLSQDTTKSKVHPAADQPFFKIRMYDQSGAEIVCARYDVNITSSAAIGGFQKAPDPRYTNVEVVYKNWSQVMIPLVNYVGQNVTITFESSDCDKGAHYGYAYLAVDCAPFEVILSNPFLCNKSTVTMTAPAGAGTYSWSGPGIMGSNTGQVITINKEGTYTVDMTTIGNGGVVCPFSIDTLIPKSVTTPVAAFTNNTVCVGTATDFTDNSAPNIVAWDWNFGESPTSTLTNPSHTYSTASTFNATLIVTDNLGCKDTVIHPVTVNPKPTVAFTATTACLGTATVFTNTSTPNTSGYTWVFGDGTASSSAQNPTHTYATAGTNNVTLVVTTPLGCTDALTKPVVVNTKPTAAFTPIPACTGSECMFTNTSSPGTSTYSWNFGDGSPSSTFSDPTHTYTTASTFNVILTATDPGSGCTDVITKTVTINQSPAPVFTASTVCVGSPTVFTDQTPVNPTIVTWDWDFNNDGSVDDTNPNPTYSYAAGTYTASLTVTTNSTPACSATYTTTVTVNAKPVAGFTAPQVCLNSATIFTNTSTGTVASSAWNFGDAATAITSNATHTYAAANSYNVKLVVMNGVGCKDSITKTAVVNPNPVADYTATTVCMGAANNFTNNSTPLATSAFSWDFGDSNFSILQDPSHAYASAGPRNVKLVVTTPSGCKDSVTKVITVNANPVPLFTAAPVCEGSITTFVNQTPLNPSVASWDWDFNKDGTVDDITQNPTYTYTPGTYTASLVATTNSVPACSATYTTTVTVYPNPVAAFVASAECMGNATAFDNSASDIAAPDVIVSYDWDFGDGKTQSANNPNHLYTNCGSYIANLTIKSNHNCSSATSRPVLVNCNPIVAFTAPDVCLNLITDFTNNSSIVSGSIATWDWKFGDGGLNGTKSPSYTYLKDGTYTVSLTATSDKGCTASKTIPVKVFPLPVAMFSYIKHTCLGSPTSLKDASTISSGNIGSYDWDLNNDGIVDNHLQNPVLFATSPGWQKVHLAVLSDHACPGDTVMSYYVNPNPDPTMAVDDPDGCPVHHANLSGGVIPASVDHANSIIKWQWDIESNGSVEFTNDYPQGKNTDLVAYDFINNDPTSPKMYSVTLTVTTDSGCVGSRTSSSQFVTVFPQPRPGFTWTPNEPKPDILSPRVSFYNQAIGATSVKWNFGDGHVRDPKLNVSTLWNPEHDYEYESAVSSFYDVWQWVVNDYGCKDSVMHTLEILPNWTFYIPNAFTPNGDGMNDGFGAKAININSFNLWIFDRWGNMIFYSNQLDLYWDGTVQGHEEIVQEDVYVWKVKFKDIFGKNHNQVGTVTLVK